MDKATERELLNAFDKLGYKTSIVTRSKDGHIITIALNSTAVNWVDFIIEISIRNQWIHNIYTLHGILTSYDLKKFEATVFNAFRKDI